HLTRQDDDVAIPDIPSVQRPQNQISHNFDFNPNLIIKMEYMNLIQMNLVFSVYRCRDMQLKINLIISNHKLLHLISTSKHIKLVHLI
ncbi:MAG: hypothetical protein EZS28_035188, partial [Streblomastix strix]